MYLGVETIDREDYHYDNLYIDKNVLRFCYGYVNSMLMVGILTIVFGSIL